MSFHETVGVSERVSTTSILKERIVVFTRLHMSEESGTAVTFQILILH